MTSLPEIYVISDIDGTILDSPFTDEYRDVIGTSEWRKIVMERRVYQGCVEWFRKMRPDKMWFTTGRGPDMAVETEHNVHQLLRRAAIGPENAEIEHFVPKGGEWTPDGYVQWKLTVTNRIIRNIKDTTDSLFPTVVIFEDDERVYNTLWKHVVWYRCSVAIHFLPTDREAYWKDLADGVVDR